jgi:CDP-diacylglycerol--serine O-phosphatidyltransferase
VVFLLVLGFVLVSSDPPKVLFGLFMMYGISGHFVWIWRRLRRRAVPANPPGTPT